MDSVNGSAHEVGKRVELPSTNTNTPTGFSAADWSASRGHVICFELVNHLVPR
jgi:hypothetical protein